jgi:hypothetical protein
VATAASNRLICGAPDPPPFKWFDLSYVFDIKEDCKANTVLPAGRCLVSQGQNLVDANRQMGVSEVIMVAPGEF